MRLVPLAIWCVKLDSDDDLFEAVRLCCGFTHLHSLVVECCYLYCYAIKQLVKSNGSSKQAFQLTKEESQRRARLTGLSTIKYWIENDIEENEMIYPHYRPESYIKTAFVWCFYYLKHDYTLKNALNDIIKRGGDTSANAAVVGGLIGAS